MQSRHTKVTCGGVDAYVWPGGGITMMVDVSKMPDQSFGYVPTPALVAPLEFTVSKEDYIALGGHETAIRSIKDIVSKGGEYSKQSIAKPPANKDHNA